MKARKLFLLLSGVLITVLLISSWADVGRLAGKFVFYMRVAELYLEPPDTELLMPIKEVKTRQIANTWHVPRTGDRLHEGQDIFAAKDTPIYSATVGYILRIDENDLGGHGFSSRSWWTRLLLRASGFLCAEDCRRRLRGYGNCARICRYDWQC